MPQKQYKPHYAHLKNKWTDRRRELQKTLWKNHKDSLNWASAHAKQAIIGSAGALAILTNPIQPAAAHHNPAPAHEFPIQIDSKLFLIEDLSHELPGSVEPLSIFQQQAIAQTLSRHFNMTVSAQLQGKSLNTQYGYIGQEQHLALYPGDNIYEHFDSQSDADNYSSTGMAPGLGAWGYFAPNKSQLTNLDKAREKYYIAVQTFLSPGFEDNVVGYNAFFKYRKMLVVNPENGKALIADIADAGPSAWTGKQLGGSPEVMKYLERVDGADRGPVLYFFIDELHDKIPLGPISPK